MGFNIPPETMKMGQKKIRVSRLKKLEIAYILLCISFESITGESVTINTNPKSVSENDYSSFELKGVRNNISQGHDLKEFSNNNPLKRNLRHASFISTTKENLSESEIAHPSGYISANALLYSRAGSSEVGKRNAQTSLIPFPRLGRKSSKFDPNLIMPYPDSWIEPYLQKPYHKSEELFSDEDTHFEDMPMNYEYVSEDSNENIVEDEEPLVKVDDNSHSTENKEESVQSEHVKSLRKRQVDDNGTIIPYPRLGREEEEELQGTYNGNEHLIRKKRNSDFIIPQIRYGRSKLSAKQVKPSKQSYFIVPNYRPGRSLNVPKKLLKIDAVSNQRLLPYPRPGRAMNNQNGYIVPQPRFGRSTEEKTIIEISSSPEELREMMKSGETFVIPYPRPGKRFFGTKPLPPNVVLESKGKEQSNVQESKVKDTGVITFVLPYPRPGRSNNKNNENIFVIPYARPGRSSLNGLLPYPRLGRANNSGSQYYILPYPRAGRAHNSELLFFSPEFGQFFELENNIDSRLKKYSTNSILPYPRMGRSQNKLSAQSRLTDASKSTFVLPYPRLGRAVSSGSLIPQFRVGKSAQNDLFQEEFESFYYDNSKQKEHLNSKNQMGNENDAGQNSDEGSLGNQDSEISNNKLKSSVLVPAKKLNRHMLTGESHYMLPYPRPGRFV